MSPEALMRFYIGHGLRQDVARLARDDDAPHSSSATLQALEDAQARRRLTSFASPDNCSGIWASDPQSLKFHGVSQVKCLLACFGIAVLLAATSSGQRRSACDEAYPDFCIPPPPPDLDCKDVHGKKPFRVRGSDPHHFDRDGDGWACEPRPMRH